MEIDLGDAKPVTKSPSKAVQQTPTKAASASDKQMEPPTPVPVKAEPAPQEKTKVTEEVEEEAAPAPREVHGVLKAKDYYEAGIKYYKKKEYDQAIKFLKKATEKKDKYTPKYVYAEANAMLGVIYQFHIVHYKTAAHYYQAALRYEKKNPTAKKHLKEVLKKKKSRYWN